MKNVHCLSVRKAKGMRRMWAHQGWDILFGWIYFDHSVHKTQRHAYKKRKRFGGRGRERRRKRKKRKTDI